LFVTRAIIQTEIINHLAAVIRSDTNRSRQFVPFANVEQAIFQSDISTGRSIFNDLTRIVTDSDRFPKFPESSQFPKSSEASLCPLEFTILQMHLAFPHSEKKKYCDDSYYSTFATEI
jgi:hypothetical protein